MWLRFSAVRFGLSLKLAPMLASDAKKVSLKAGLVYGAPPFYRLSTEAHNKTKHRHPSSGIQFQDLLRSS